MFYMFLYVFHIMNGEFANVLEDQGSITGQVIPRTHKLVIDAPLLTLSILR